MKQVSAFLARSFAPEDDRRIQPVLDFLDTFKKAGFFWETAEPAEVELVSAKVRNMIDANDVFIAIFTRRHPVYRFESRIGGAIKILSGTAEPVLWSTPAWLLQESGYALHAGKALILLKEPDVEVSGLQGDLEYIPFDPQQPSAVFSKLSQMINALLAKAAGTEFRIAAKEYQVESQLAAEATPPTTAAVAPESEAETTTIFSRFFTLLGAGKKRDIDTVNAEWKAGTELISSGKGDNIDQVEWDCYYHEARYECGTADGLDSLRSLREANKTRMEPPLAIARCLDTSKEFDESAEMYLQAAELQEGFGKERSLLNAAKSFLELKMHDKGLVAVDRALAIDCSELRDEAVWTRYQLFKLSKKDYFAFAAAESALHENPQFSFRFNLALDYRLKNLNELALYHFKFISGRNEQDFSSLHNLALVYADCKLPISSVTRYKKSMSMGETLSAANLGFMYLDAGMVDEAKDILARAMAEQKHASRVEKCLAAIIQQGEAEKEKETELLETANSKKRFFVQMGNGLTAKTPAIDGNWKFPFGTIPLTMTINRLSGTVDVKTADAGFGNIFALPGAPKTERTLKYTLQGVLTGAVCEFELTTADITVSTAIFAPISFASGPKSGFLIFELDGKSAMYAELSDGKLGVFEKLNREG